jgi:hypothetical protein
MLVGPHTNTTKDTLQKINHHMVLTDPMFLFLFFLFLF